MNKPLTTDSVCLKRLHFRSWHRGWKETDLILGQFADAMLAKLSASELEAYAALLEEDDDILWNWITGKESPPAHLQDIVAKLEGFGRVG